MTPLEVKKQLYTRLEAKKSELLEKFKQHLAESVYESPEMLLEKARIKIVKARIRKGKVQRRVKVSGVKGFTYRSKKGRKQLVRMMPRERIKRKIGQRRGKIKRKAKASRTKIKYNRSMRRRKGLGLK